MKFNPLTWFKKEQEADIDFRDPAGSTYETFPIRMARDVVMPSKEIQKKQFEKYQMPNCPGMWDYSQYGYIIPSPETIKIKANKAGVVSVIKRRSGSTSTFPMNADFVSGIVKFEDVKPNAHKYDLPWKVVCKKEISAFLMPPFYHATYLDDIYIVPGIVDYKDYWTLNFIYSIKRACEVTINAGDPLLHVLPFWNKPIRANYGMMDIQEIGPTLTSGFESIPHFYRKTFNKKKVFKLGKSDGSDE